MKQFDELTKYIPLIEKATIGHCQVSQEGPGSIENEIQFPFVIFSEIVEQFVEDIYAMVERFPKWELTHYSLILERNSLRWGSKSMSEAREENFDAQCVCALLIGAVRAERFCDGTLMKFFQDGSICRWLKRLEVIDKG